MKDLITDANFPKTAEGAVYHLGLKAGDLANRIITVGDPARAKGIATLLDPLEQESDIFALQSERGFLTLTGKYKGVSVSIVAIGMGAPNMDFFVREGREILDDSGMGDMIIIRFGSCGGLVPDLPVGSLTVPKAAIAVNRNYDFDFVNTEEGIDSVPEAYRISKPAAADPRLQQLLLETLRETVPASTPVKDDHLNASADSFYSSQGRNTSFPDQNVGLTDRLVEMGVGSLEMETFHLLHLASNWPRKRSNNPVMDGGQKSLPPPPTNMPAETYVVSPSSTATPVSYEESGSFIRSAARGVKEDNEANDGSEVDGEGEDADVMNGTKEIPRIRAAAVQMIFAERYSRAFISPAEVESLQVATAKGLLETLIRWK